jgi:RNA polymerase sigma-70 factor, ECF subfamily
VRELTQFKTADATQDYRERELIQSAQRGDAAAFERLYTLYGRRVYSLCLRMVENTAEAEDLTQEVFLLLFRKIQTFRGDSAFSTWLHRIAVNTVLMRFRKKNVANSSLEEIASRSDERSDDSIDAFLADPCPVSTVDAIHLERAIDCLPPRYKLAVTLHDVHGYKHQEIARIAGVTVMNSKSILCRARMRLRDLLNHGSRQKRRTAPARALAA